MFYLHKQSTFYDSFKYLYAYCIIHSLLSLTWFYLSPENSLFSKVLRSESPSLLFTLGNQQYLFFCCSPKRFYSYPTLNCPKANSFVESIKLNLYLLPNMLSKKEILTAIMIRLTVSICKKLIHIRQNMLRFNKNKRKL